MTEDIDKKKKPKRQSWHSIWERAPRATRTDRKGNLFASKGELARWENLLLWQVSGEIRNLKRQVKFALERGDIKVLTPTGKQAFYTADFVYERKDTPGRFTAMSPDGWFEVIEDFKGYRDKTSSLRISIFEALSGKKVHIVKK